jgi:hypothetical protein
LYCIFYAAAHILLSKAWLFALKQSQINTKNSADAMSDTRYMVICLKILKEAAESLCDVFFKSALLLCNFLLVAKQFVKDLLLGLVTEYFEVIVDVFVTGQVAVVHNKIGCLYFNSSTLLKHIWFKQFAVGAKL